MKNNILLFGTFCFFISISLFFPSSEEWMEGKKEISAHSTAMKMEADEMQSTLSKRDRMDLAWEQEYRETYDPSTGTIPKERLLDAWKYMQSLQYKFGKAAIAGVNWQERGPNNCGGRTRAICIDLNDITRKTVFAAGVGGGLWKTTDITQTNPNWAPVNDFFQNIAITSIDQAPGNPQIMYFCTGEGNGNIDAARGLGVWKSTNGGNTWTQLSATNNSSYYYCNKVFSLGAGDTVFVCTNSGMFRSVNGGTTFSTVLASGISSAGGSKCYDIERAYNGTLYATMSSGSGNSGSIHKSYNNGTTWTNPLSFPSYVQDREIEIAIATNDTNTIWGLVENGGAITGIVKSTNAGVSFDTTAGYPADSDAGVQSAGSKDFSRGQAWYDLSIAVDPNNSSVCYVGGVDLFKTANGGSTWVQVGHWYGGFGIQNVHADQHYALFEPGNSNVVYFSNDGGVYRASNSTAAMPIIVSKEANYRTTQFYACDIHPTAGMNYYLAGAQDNGSHKFSTTGINATVEVTGGDGAFCHIDQNQPLYQYTSYVYSAYRRSTDGGTSFSSISFGSNRGQFINPTDYDDSLNMMYASDKSGMYQRWNNTISGSSFDTVVVAAFNNSSVSNVRVSPNVLRRVYFGTYGGRIVRVDTADTNTPTATHINNGMGMPTSTVSCIEIERGNENHILVCYSNYGVNSVWESKNGGSSWTSVEGNLPDMPIRWLLLNPDKPWQALAATELGVWSTDTLMGTSTNWQPSTSGLANVRCTMLKMRRSDKAVIVSTHGRGLFSSDVFMNPNADFGANRTIIYQGQRVQFSDYSSKATSYLWNFGDGTTSTQANPLKIYNNAGVYTVTLTINGGASIKSMSNYISVLPFRPVPYSPAMGGDFESNFNDFIPVTTSGTAFERGNSSITGKNGTASGTNAWVTGLTSSNYANNTLSYLYTPNFNFTASGTYTIRFKAKNKFEIGYDGYRMEYSTDTGITWLPLGTTVVANWYDYANTSTGRPFAQNQAFFNATNTAFTLKSFVTTTLQGFSQVCFRFVFGSDYVTTDAGLAIDDFEILGPSNPQLPVHLLELIADRISMHQIDVKWKTSMEIQNAGFYIERSTNYDKGFESIGFVSGKINTRSISNYLFQDMNAPASTLFYRLKQTDVDGKWDYSPVVVVEAYRDKTNALLSSLKTMPDGVTFVFGLHQPIAVDADIYAVNGQLVRRIKIQDNESVLLDDLAKGIYFIRLTYQQQTETTRIFVR